MGPLTDELSQSLLRLDKKHRSALQWFFDHTGEVVPWADLTDPELRLACSPKGIYKPKGLDYALSVKQTLGSSYADHLPRADERGVWKYRYHEESRASGESAALHTNRGLQRCMIDRVPVGVLIQATAKPNVTYQVWGLAMVRDWADGFFILEGQQAQPGAIVSFHDATTTRIAAEEKQDAYL